MRLIDPYSNLAKSLHMGSFRKNYCRDKNGNCCILEVGDRCYIDGTDNLVIVNYSQIFGLRWWNGVTYLDGLRFGEYTIRTCDSLIFAYPESHAKDNIFLSFRV